MKRFQIVYVIVAALVAGAASAADPSPETDDPRARIAAKFPGTRAQDVRPSPVKGVWEVPMGADTAYVSADGRYIFAGDLYEIDTRTNLTEANRATDRTRRLAKLDEREMIVFGPASAKHTITVFTDVDCGYCRKLHSQIDEINKLGVRVRYLAYPRSGPGSADWRKMEAVWCASDRKNAITQAKLGRAVEAKACAAPVARQYELGEDFGVRGTPAIFTSKGEYIGGYLSPQQLMRRLEELSSGS
ncbi:MAG TPA: DsbC family protein [Steroidobacter sp.]|jgi:thiol:disulfide interchange protein DsbC|nr:DsbC family protein [Steroidobacteraceae bacterium]HLS81126.1 DsbC family protein [Steroidobacter sp.]